MASKVIHDMLLTESRRLSTSYGLLTLQAPAPLPPVEPGQFVQVRVDSSKSTFLRRPISINDADSEKGEIRLLVRAAGEGTEALLAAVPGQTINTILPLGRGFTMPAPGSSESILLIGGGVGVAPLLLLGRRLRQAGFNPEFLLGARSESDLFLLPEFSETGTVHITTDDGSAGERGVVTAHSRLLRPVDRIYCCGPVPMMKAVATAAVKLQAQCEVSLENMMACGLGACLCCVEKTVRGNVCVCTEGPVFNINQLTWSD